MGCDFFETRDALFGIMNLLWAIYRALSRRLVTPKGSEFSKGIRTPKWPKHSGVAPLRKAGGKAGVRREVALFQVKDVYIII